MPNMVNIFDIYTIKVSCVDANIARMLINSKITSIASTVVSAMKSGVANICSPKEIEINNLFPGSSGDKFSFLHRNLYTKIF